jgi:hypothetical protein
VTIFPDVTSAICSKSVSRILMNLPAIKKLRLPMPLGFQRLSVIILTQWQTVINGSCDRSGRACASA